MSKLSEKFIDISIRQGYEPEMTAVIELAVTQQGFSCPHTKDSVIPRVLHVFSDGSYGGDYVCLDCLLEWVESHKEDIGL